MLQQPLQCDLCLRYSMAYYSLEPGRSGPSTTPQWVAFWEGVRKPTVWYPRAVGGRKYEYVPEVIASAANEAHRVHSINAYRATAILCRATIEAVCKEKKAEGRDLFNKIEDLSKRGLIREFVKDTAQVLRAIGNDMAHGDFGAPLESADADDVLSFMDSILEELYESPGRLERLKRMADARKQAAKKQG